MPLEPGCAEDVVARNIAELMKDGHPKDQAAAIAYANCRDQKEKSLGNIGAMIALYPDPQVAAALFVNATEDPMMGSQAQPPDDMHVTLVYMGEAAPIADKEAALSAALQTYAASCECVDAVLNGLARFYTDEENGTHPLVVTVDSPALPQLRQDLVSMVQAAGVEPVLNHGFVPHITIAYISCDGPTPAINFQPVPAPFIKLSLVMGDKRTDFPFRGSVQDKAMRILKQANGLYRWFSISSNNIKDRDGETIRLKALQADVARTRMFGDDSHLRFYHIPYDIGGAPDYRAIVDGMLVESGEFYDEPVAKTIAEYCDAHPEGLDGTGWGVSIGYKGNSDQEAAYDSTLIDERSLLALSKAANEWTLFGVQNAMTISPDQQKALDTVLASDELVGIVETSIAAKEKSKMADGAGVVRKAATTPEVPVFKTAGSYAATPQDALGFDPPPTHQKDASAVEAAIQTEAELVVAARAASDAASAAMNHTDATISAAIAEGALASATAEPTQPQNDGLTPEAPPAAAKATDAADPEKPATPANKETPATATTPEPQKGMSDEDMQGIAKFVNETVQKAIADAMTQMKAEMTALSGDMQKMRQTFSIETQVKMLNEVPKTAYERLKAFGVTPAAAVPKTISGFVNGIPTQVPNPQYVEKGNNLPTAPDNPVAGLMTALGFGGPQEA